MLLTMLTLQGDLGELLLQTTPDTQEPQLKPERSKTFYLLLSIVVVFIISWLPLNILNVLLDVWGIDSVFNW